MDVFCTFYQGCDSYNIRKFDMYTKKTLTVVLVTCSLFSFKVSNVNNLCQYFVVNMTDSCVYVKVTNNFIFMNEMFEKLRKLLESHLRHCLKKLVDKFSDKKFQILLIMFL